MSTEDEIVHGAAEDGKDPRTRWLMYALGVAFTLSLLTTFLFGYLSWRAAQDKADAGAQVAEQLRRVCAQQGELLFENRNLCENATELAKDDPEIQDREVDDPDPNDPEFQDPEIQDPELADAEQQDPELNDLEAQEAELQDEEVQDGEVDDPDPNDPDPVDDPDPNDPDPDDPDPNDPDPAAPGTWNCPDGQYMEGFTRNPDGSISLNCKPLPNGGGNPQRN